MAFFGLTTLGTQSPFQAALIENLGLQLFSEEELRESFDKFDKDGSHNLDITEMEAFLTDVYHGPPPAAEVKRVMGIFDSNKDGKVSWDEFRITVKRMKNDRIRETKEEEKPSSASEFETASEIREAMRRHIRPTRDPKSKFVEPVTTSQQVGWDKESGVSEVRYPKKSCTETKYAAAMAQSGIYM